MILSFQLMKFLCSLSYVGNLKQTKKASESLKIIQVVSPIEFTKAQINTDKGMPFNWKNPEFNHLIASVFQLSPSKFCSKAHRVSCWNELENEQ